MMGRQRKVQTVLGLISPEALGITLMHEHLLTDLSVFFIEPDEASAKEIAQMLGVSQATISYHISNLVTSKILVLDKNEGKFAYRVNFEHLESVYQAMREDFGIK